jgi:hypothetical protein
MMREEMGARLARIETDLERHLVRRTQLKTALRQTDELVKRLEGASSVLRDLLQAEERAPSGGPDGAAPPAADRPPD